jgi:hypothetical protein
VGSTGVRIWEDNIKRYVEERIWGDVYWISVGEDRNQWRAMVNTAMDVRDFIENLHGLFASQEGNSLILGQS